MSFDLDSCAQVMDLEATLGTRDEELDALRQRLQGERTAMAAQQQSLLELRAKLLQVSLSVSLSVSLDLSFYLSLSLSLSVYLSLSLSHLPQSLTHGLFLLCRRRRGAPRRWRAWRRRRRTRAQRR
jgi:hypothetical protein